MSNVASFQTKGSISECYKSMDRSQIPTHRTISKSTHTRAAFCACQKCELAFWASWIVSTYVSYCIARWYGAERSRGLIY